MQKKVPSNLLVKNDICIDLAHLAVFFSKLKKQKKYFEYIGLLRNTFIVL